jgi:predicted RNase H-like HicB family nuclease
MKKTARYFGLLDGEAGAYGIAFPDAPGCAAMGATEDLAIVNAIAALAEWIAYSDKNGFERPEARNAVDFRRDAEVIEAVRGGGDPRFRSVAGANWRAGARQYLCRCRYTRCN